MDDKLLQLIKELVKIYPNDMDLGRYVRKIILEKEKNDRDKQVN